MRLDRLHYLFLALAAVLFFYLWLTPYSYEHVTGDHLVRINRFTGSTEILRPQGWRPMPDSNSQ